MRSQWHMLLLDLHFQDRFTVTAWVERCLRLEEAGLRQFMAPRIWLDPAVSPNLKPGFCSGVDWLASTTRQQYFTGGKPLFTCIVYLNLPNHPNPACLSGLSDSNMRVCKNNNNLQESVGYCSSGRSLKEMEKHCVPELRRRVNISLQSTQTPERCQLR